MQNTQTVIVQRRSIRKYKETPLKREQIERILQAAAMAPSAKNQQPWRFIVVQGGAKQHMIDAMHAGINRFERGEGYFRAVGPLLAAARHTVSIMQQAPVTVFFVNTKGMALEKELSAAERMLDLLNVQSVSAAVENLLIAAQAEGLGTLWIGDIFFAERELAAWLGLGRRETLMAAVAVGYPDETPSARPRKPMEELISWME